MATDFVWMDPDEELRILQEAGRIRREQQRRVDRIDPQVAQRAIQLARMAPQASPGLVTTAAMVGMDDDTFAQLAAMDDGGQVGPTNTGRFVNTVTSGISSGWDLLHDQVIKPIVRGTFATLESLSESVQRPLVAGYVAATDPDIGFGEAYRDYGGTVLDHAFSQAARGEGFDLGTGYMPAGAAREAQQAGRTLEIHGQPANFGRVFAAETHASVNRFLSPFVDGELLTPGGTAYNVVAGVAQFGADVLTDPSAIVLGGSGTAARAAARAGASARTVQLIEGGVMGVRQRARALDGGQAAEIVRRAGGYQGHARRTVLIEEAERFFRDRTLLRRLADADSYEILQSFQRSPANRIDRTLIGRLGNATDEGQIAEILLGAVSQGHLMQRGFYGGPGLLSEGRRQFRRKVREMRFAGLAPQGTISADDLDQAALKLDSLLRQARVAADDVLDDAGQVVIRGRASTYDRIARLEEGDFEGLFAVVTDAMDDIARTVPGRADTSLRNIARGYADEVDAFRRYATDELGDAIRNPLVPERLVQTVDGEVVETLVPSLKITSHLIDGSFQLPDAATIRRAATKNAMLRAVYQSRGWDYGTLAAQGLTRDVFKPLAILRPAYIVRIGAEEQARLAAAGYDSLFTHPFRFIMANVRARRDLADLSGRSLELLARDTGVITRDAMAMLRDRTRSRAHLWDTTRMDGSAQAITAWRRELGQLAAAPEMRALAAARGNLDEWVRWVRTTDEGRTTLARLVQSEDALRPMLTSDRHLREWGREAQRYLEAKTFRHGDLTDLVASGRLGDDATLGAARLNRLLRSKFDAGDAPAYVKIERAATEMDRLKGGYDRAIAGMFDYITGKPTSYFARFPAYRQGIVAALGDLMPNMATNRLRQDVIDQAARNLRLTRVERAKLEEAARRNVHSQGVIGTLDDVNDIAKSRSLEQVNELMFDLTKRSSAQQAFDVAIPFLDAWKEVTLTWARLLKENPAFFIRAQAGYRSLDEGGVIYPNDFGENVFAYPGGGALSNFIHAYNARGGGIGAAVGAAVEAAGQTIRGDGPAEDARLRLEGRVEGVNLVVQGIGPGFGPVVQWATGAFVPDTADYQHLRAFMAPFGTGGVSSPEDLANLPAMLESLFPAWARKVWNGWTEGGVDEVQWNSTVGDMMTVLAESGLYSPADPTDAQRLIADAERGARWILLVRGVVQAVGPTGPAAVWELRGDQQVPPPQAPETWRPEQDPDGVFHSLAVYANEYRRLAYDKYGGDHQLAASEFVSMYGLEPYYIAQAKTRGISELPVTRQAHNWVMERRAAADRHASVIGYFAPPDDAAEMDFGVWRDQIARGDRQSLTARQQLQLANQTKARALFHGARQMIESSGASAAAQRDAMAVVRAALEEQFPGWSDPVLGVEQRADQTARIAALYRAVDDPDLADSPLIEPLRMYLDGRQQLLAVLRRRTGLSNATFARQDAADLREVLRGYGQYLETQYVGSGFQGVWTQLLQREIEA